MRRLAMTLVVLLTLQATAGAQQPQFDVVIANGRVIDPESRLDATRFLGIRNGKIEAISATPISGKTTFDAKGLVVAPGFIDLHAHGQDDENYRIFALDGVTTALELEVGTGDIPAFYGSREGKALINYGASAGHIRARMAVMKDPSTGLLPTGPGGHQVASDAQIADMKQRVTAGLAAGALGRWDGAAVHARRYSLRSAGDVPRGRQVSRTGVRSRAVVRHAGARGAQWSRSSR